MFGKKQQQFFKIIAVLDYSGRVVTIFGNLSLKEAKNKLKKLKITKNKIVDCDVDNRGFIERKSIVHAYISKQG